MPREAGPGAAMSMHIVKKFHAFVGDGRFEEALALFAENAWVEFHGPASNPLAGRHAGRAAIARFFERIGCSFEVQLFEASEFIDAGDTVVVLGRERSRVKATGRVFDVPWAQIWRTRGDRIVSLTDFFDTGSMAPAFEPIA
jgi:ketosteroid isomerase-like protein